MNNPKIVDEKHDKQKKRQRPADSIAAEAALRRAAIKARKRAIEMTGSVPTWRDGKIVYDTEVWPADDVQTKQDVTDTAR